MRKKTLWVQKISSLILLLAILLSLGFILSNSSQPVWAASTINVTTTAEENGSGAGCSLREAIDSANTNANFGGCVGSGGGSPFTINVPAGAYILTTGEIQVGTVPGVTITISGAGSGSTVVQQSTANARIFNLDPNVLGNVAVSISGLTLLNGAAQVFGGGAILGGGPNDSLNLSNVVIQNNTCGGFFSGAGISWSPAGNVTISNSAFLNNTCASGAAGAILYTAGTGSILTISNTTFSGNSAGVSGSAGGALFLGGNVGSPTFNINGSVFTNNLATHASGIGGAIYLGGGTLNLGSTAANRFFGNTAGIASSGGLGVRGGIANATNNWWGCNGGPGSGSGCDKADNSGGTLNFTPWIVLSNTANPDSILTSQTSTLTADFLHNSANGSLPSSQVAVLVGLPVSWGSAVNGTLSNTQASIQSNGTATATFTPTASGNGSAQATVQNGVATASLTIQSQNPNTTTTINADSPDPSVVGQAVTVSYTVTVSPPASGTPTGSVTVTDGTISCTASVAAGQCALTFTSAGARSLTATYAGDANFNGSTSAAEAHQVNPASTTTTILSDTPDPSADGQAVTVTFSVTVNAPGAGTPTGTVTVGDITTSCTSLVATGQCDITLSGDGPHNLAAIYSGDSNFNTSTSTSVPHTVDALAPSVTINQAAGQADPTVVSPVNFTVVFSEPVTGFSDSDISLAGTAGPLAAAVTGGPATYEVAVSGMSASGSVIASIQAGAALDPVGNPSQASTSTDNTVTFIYDTTPPDTTITASPANPSSSTSASFTFSGSDNLTPAGSLTFQCKLDGDPFGACASPKAYSGLSLGSHTFEVAAVDGVGNVDPSPATYTWSIQGTTTLLYNGGQIVNVGSTFQPAAKLSSAAAACVNGQSISFALDSNPLTGVPGTYLLGSATTNSSGQATLNSINTTGWQEGIYTLTASYTGSTGCVGSSDTATLTVASPGTTANGGGWYTLTGSGRINFGFTVRKADPKCLSSCVYKGQLLLMNNGKWRLKGTLNTYSRLSNGNGASGGAGDLYWWNASLNGGLGDWALAQTNVSFTINFYDSGNTGKTYKDAFGIRIVYTPVAPQPGILPNSKPQFLKGGDIRVQ